jgi:large subunit ribosomal protein L18e
MKINAEKANIKEWLSIAEKGRHGESHPKLWRKIYDCVAVPRRSRCDVNLYKINRCSEKGDYVVVPGKVLSTGVMDHSITITAIEYSSKALEELKNSNCTMLDISALYNSLKDGKKQIKIIKK